MLFRALEDRPTRRPYARTLSGAPSYRAPNSATLKRNNDISFSLLRSLCGGKKQNEVCKAALLVLKSHESISVTQTREMLAAALKTCRLAAIAAVSFLANMQMGK